MSTGICRTCKREFVNSWPKWIDGKEYSEKKTICPDCTVNMGRRGPFDITEERHRDIDGWEIMTAAYYEKEDENEYCE